MKTIATFAFTLLLAWGAAADDRTFKEFGDNRVYFSAFNSSFIAAEVASIYNINRGNDRGLVNIALVPEGSESGKTALVTGTVNDLLARQQVLEFIEVREGDAVYYLAPFRFDNEDPLTFNVSVQPAGSAVTHRLTFKRTFYHD